MDETVSFPNAGASRLITCFLSDGTVLYDFNVVQSEPFSDISPVAGLKNLKYLQFHESGVSDISPIYDLDLELMNPCSDGTENPDFAAGKTVQ